MKTKAGQIIEFVQKIDSFGWELRILVGDRQIRLSLTDEELKLIELDLRKKIKQWKI